MDRRDPSADAGCGMMSSRNAHTDDGVTHGSDAGDRGPLTLGQLAHELAGLVDGGRRNVDLVLERLRAQALADEQSQLLPRLEAANQAMHQMADLLRQWMDAQRGSQPLEQDGRTLADAIDHAVRLLTPAAEQRGIRLAVRVQPQAATLPAGPIYAVVANAVRNAIEAIDGQSADDPWRGTRIDVCARIEQDASQREMLMVSVTDDGPGLAPGLVGDGGALHLGVTTKPHGHGLGLQLCHEIAQSLGGHLTLHNGSPRGAVLTLTCPTQLPPQSREGG
jgi:signal transduction histidine kinase